jgi:hypothetical protein
MLEPAFEVGLILYGLENIAGVELDGKWVSI